MAVDETIQTPRKVEDVEAEQASADALRRARLAAAYKKGVNAPMQMPAMDLRPLPGVAVEIGEPQFKLRMTEHPKKSQQEYGYDPASDSMVTPPPFRPLRRDLTREPPTEAPAGVMYAGNPPGPLRRKDPYLMPVMDVRSSPPADEAYDDAYDILEGARVPRAPRNRFAEADFQRIMRDVREAKREAAERAAQAKKTSIMRAPLAMKKESP